MLIYGLRLVNQETVDHRSTVAIVAPLPCVKRSAANRWDHARCNRPAVARPRGLDDIRLQLDYKVTYHAATAVIKNRRLQSPQDI
ncbi:MAG: hypothetical protein R2932_34605 [Caldilineaceae bacterium]